MVLLVFFVFFVVTAAMIIAIVGAVSVGVGVAIPCRHLMIPQFAAVHGKPLSQEPLQKEKERQACALVCVSSGATRNNIATRKQHVIAERHSDRCSSATVVAIASVPTVLAELQNKNLTSHHCNQHRID